MKMLLDYLLKNRNIITVVVSKDDYGWETWQDYLLCSMDGKYWIYNTSFIPDDVEKICVYPNHTEIYLKGKLS